MNTLIIVLLYIGLPFSFISFIIGAITWVYHDKLKAEAKLDKILPEDEKVLEAVRVAAKQKNVDDKKRHKLMQAIITQRVERKKKNANVIKLIAISAIGLAIVPPIITLVVASKELTGNMDIEIISSPLLVNTTGTRSTTSNLAYWLDSDTDVTFIADVKVAIGDDIRISEKDISTDNLIEHAEEELNLARENGRKLDEGIALEDLAWAHFKRLGQTEKSIALYEQALVIFREIGSKGHEGSILNELGYAHFDLGQMEKAIEFYERALVIQREIAIKRNIHSQLARLGLAHYNLGQASKAIEYFEQAVAIDREVGYRRGEGVRLSNLGLTHFKLGQVEKAVEYYEQALTVARNIGHEILEGSTLSNLGIAYQSLGQIKEAKEFLQQSLAIFEAIKSPHTDTVRRWLSE